METITESASGAPDVAGGTHGEESTAVHASGKDTVSYDTYRRTLGQLKAAQNKLAELSERSQTLEDEKLAAEGKKEELVESYKKKYEEERDKRKTQIRAFADEITFRQFESEASKFGCIKPEDLFTLYKQRIQALEISDDLKVDPDEIREIIEEAKVQRPFFFKKDSPRLSTDLPGDMPKPKTKTLKQMSIDELKEAYRQAASKR